MGWYQIPVNENQTDPIRNRGVGRESWEFGDGFAWFYLKPITNFAIQLAVWRNNFDEGPHIQCCRKAHLIFYNIEREKKCKFSLLFQGKQSKRIGEIAHTLEPNASWMGNWSFLVPNGESINWADLGLRGQGSPDACFGPLFLYPTESNQELDTTRMI